MFNSSARRKAIEDLNSSVEEHEVVRKHVERASVELFQQRQRAVVQVARAVEDYADLIAGSPEELDKSAAEFRVEADRFSGTVRHFETESARSTKIGSAAGAAGAMAGVGAAALGPSAAMAIATTFGTASTGTAISTLSGAMLGGGAIATGGGMAGGSALLALAGPVGWGIGGAALVGSGLYLNSRNKRFAREATEQRVKVEAEVRSLRKALEEIERLLERTEEQIRGCLDELAWLKGHAGGNYQRFSQGQKQRLAALIDHIRALSQLLNKEVAL